MGEARVCTVCTATVTEYPEGMCCHCQELPWPLKSSPTPDPALERLRELSERAKRRPLGIPGDPSYPAELEEFARAKRAFSEAAVKYVRAALSPRGDGGKG